MGLSCLCRHAATYEGDEGRHQTHDERCLGGCDRRRAWIEKGSVLQDDQQLCGHCHQGREECREICDSRCLPNQDSPEASNKGGKEDDLRQGSNGQGQASKDPCEGIPSCGTQKEHLRRCSQWP